MSAAKHTPGPWVICEDYSDRHYLVIGRENCGSILVERHVEGHAAQDMADAQLISAAPELLGALRRLLTAGGADFAAACQEANDAIAKATLGAQ